MAEKTTAISPAEKRRNEVFASMNAELQTVATALDKKLSTGAVGVVMIRYDIGQMIAQVLERETTYGSRAVELLADYRGERASVLYALRDFANSFDREYVKEWTSQPMKDGNFLTEKHWMVLRQLGSKVTQEKFLAETFKNSYSANQLELEINASGSTKKSVRSGGRLMAAPTSALAGLQKFGLLASSLCNYETQQMSPSVYDKIDEMPPDAVNEILLERLQKTFDTVTEATKRLDVAKDHLAKNVERVKEILSEKSNAAGDEAESEAPPAKKKAKKAEVAVEETKKKKKKVTAESNDEAAPEKKKAKKEKPEKASDGPAKKKKAKKPAAV